MSTILLCDENIIECNHAALAFTVRLFLGIVFLLQGYDKVFKVKMAGVIEALSQPMSTNHIARPVVVLAAYYTSFVELLAGLFLILGLFTNFALYALGLDIVMVAFAMGLAKPMWDMHHVFPRLILIVILLAIPPHWDVYSLDFLIHNK